MPSNNRNIVISGVVVALLAIGIGGWMFYTREPQAIDSTTIEIEGSASDFPFTKTTEGRKHVEDTASYHIEVMYPDTVGISATAGTSGERIALQKMEQYVKGVVSDFKKEDTGQSGIKKTLEMGYKRFESAHTVSFVFTVSADTGGAHPISYFKTFVWNKKGEALSLGGILKGNYLAKLSQLSKAQVKANIQTMSGGEVEAVIFEEGFAPTQDNFQNFYLDGTELVLLFDPYQVAAYAAGAQEVHIKLPEIKEFVQSEYLQG